MTITTNSQKNLTTDLKIGEDCHISTVEQLWDKNVVQSIAIQQKHADSIVQTILLSQKPSKSL